MRMSLFTKGEPSAERMAEAISFRARSIKLGARVVVDMVVVEDEVVASGTASLVVVPAREVSSKPSTSFVAHCAVQINAAATTRARRGRKPNNRPMVSSVLRARYTRWWQ